MEKSGTGDNPLQGFTDFLTKTFGGAGDLLATGPAGLGALVFILVFLALIFAMVTGSAISPNLKSLLNRFMWLGTACFLASVAAGLVGGYMGKRHELMLTFSPDFEVENLPVPTFTPNTGKGDFKSGYIFAIGKDSQIKINFDHAIKAVKALRQAKLTVMNELGEAKVSAAMQAVQLEALDNSFKTVEAAGPKLNAVEVRALNDIGGGLSQIRRNMIIP